MIWASGRSDLPDELDDAAHSLPSGSRWRLYRQAPADAAAAVQGDAEALVSCLPVSTAGQHDLARSSARCEIAAREDIEADV